MSDMRSYYQSDITSINQINHDLDDSVFFLRLTFRYQQSQGDESIIGKALGAVFTVEDGVTCQKEYENSCSYALVPIGEGMILNNEIEQVGCFLFDAWTPAASPLFELPRIPQ